MSNVTGRPVTSHGELVQLVRDREGLSRQQLITETGMSRGTLYSRLDTLMRLGLVYEAEALGATGGRRARRIRFEDRGRVVLVVDLGQTHARVAVTDLLGSELRRADLPIAIAEGAVAVLGAVLDHAEKLVASGSGERLVGVGFGVPSSVDPATGRLLHATAMPGWAADALVEAVPSRFGVPLLVENDARAGAMGESRSEDETLVYLKIATGIGCGIVVGGEALRGAGGLAGAIGHVQVATPQPGPAPRCTCGRRGCLAAYSSGRALVARLGGTVTSGGGIGSVTALVEAAAQPEVEAALAAAADVLGMALAPTVATLNPHRLVLGGPLGAVPVVLERVREQLWAALPEQIRPLVERSALGSRATPRGLARLVVRKVFAPAAIDALVAATGAPDQPA
jgi:predicted NBD/HSP70 family sugar kinase